MKPKVNVAVCGRFHYTNYVRYLDEDGLLNRFYYSHRRSTDAGNLGLQRQHAVNLWYKEYLFRLHGLLTNGRGLVECSPLYTGLWQIGVLQRWSPCDILHLLAHGAGLKLIRRAKSEGATIIAEPVNQHPQELNEILHEEADRLGLKAGPVSYRIQECLAEEVGASDFLLTPSRIVRDSFVKRGYKPERAVVLPYGVDLCRFHPMNDGSTLDRTFRVICVAQISPRKGHIYLLEAWKRLRLPDAELLLIGSISFEMNAILRRYDGLFRHIPFVPNDQLREYYGRSSVFVLSSLEDGFGCVVTEAMACGLPAIVTINAGAADIVVHSKDGFVVPIRSPEAIAERLELLYRHEELRRQMSVAALTKARSDLSWHQYALRLTAIYRLMTARDGIALSSTSRHHSERVARGR